MIQLEMHLDLEQLFSAYSIRGLEFYAEIHPFWKSTKLES
jgi:hypothetical protein